MVHTGRSVSWEGITTCSNTQVLGSALMANYMDQDILTILSKVAKVVATEYESNSSRSEFNNKKQIPFIYSTLTNKLFIQPK